MSNSTATHNAVVHQIPVPEVALPVIRVGNAAVDVLPGPVGLVGVPFHRARLAVPVEAVEVEVEHAVLAAEVEAGLEAGCQWWNGGILINICKVMFYCTVHVLYMVKLLWFCQKKTTTSLSPHIWVP